MGKKKKKKRKSKNPSMTEYVTPLMIKHVQYARSVSMTEIKSIKTEKKTGKIKEFKIGQKDSSAKPSLMSNSLEGIFQRYFDSSMLQKEELIIEEPSLTEPSEVFKEWLDQYIDDHRQDEEFRKRRLICFFCLKSIDDDKYCTLFHPDHPNDFSKVYYFHSKGKCNPRKIFLHLARKKWLAQHTKSSE
ncbi:MAG: hypothetical protein ACXAC8_13615 [Candidatus Hodarchaeales archaeon]